MAEETTGAGIPAIIDTAQKAIVHKIAGQDGTELVLHPSDWKAEIIRPINPPLPENIRQHIALDDADSFISYVNEFKGPTTHLFACQSPGKITADFDYHRAPASFDGVAAPGRREHSASWTMPYSEEWRRWTGVDNKPLSQHSLAEFLEENLSDIVEPAGASVLEVAAKLSVKRKVEFESGTRLSDGTIQITYREEDSAAGRGQMAIPTEFTIGVPVFFGGAPYKVRVFLRYKIEEGKLTFRLVMHRRTFIEQDAVRESATHVGDSTGLKVLFGGVR